MQDHRSPYRFAFAFLVFGPVLTGSFHTPEKFGVLEFE